MDDEEFYAWLESLDPDMQEEMLYGFGMQDANAVPGLGGFGMGGSQPELDYGSYDLGGYNQLPQALDKKGNVLPWGLDQEAKASNIMQDLGAMTVDNALAMYGGAGSYDPQAFDDIVTPVGQPLDMSGSNYLTNMAGGSGYESYIAKFVQAGYSPSEAASELVKFLSGDIDPKLAPAREALRATIPRAGASKDPFEQFMTGQMGGKGGNVGEVDWDDPKSIMSSIDLNKITKTAEDLFEKQASIPQVGYVDPRTGMPYAGSESEPSAIKQKFNAAGMPDPFETYMDEDWLNAPISPETSFATEEANATGLKGYQDAISGVKSNERQLDELTRQYQQYMSESRGPFGGVAKGLQPNLKPPQYKIGADTGQITEAKDTRGEKESRFQYTDLSPALLKRQQGNVKASRAARQKALQEQIRLHEISTPEEGNRAYAGVRGQLLQEQGRTPMNDLLMQRAMARNLLMGRMNR
jgi:hypothetical protein